MMWPTFPTIDASTKIVDTPKKSAIPKKSMIKISLIMINPLNIIG